ncbi:MAG: hypothetical protein OXG35_30635 [Acidobacteria bacterium]|nr:hypothetical protein [Acidobacteriota bacterium]
MTEIVPPQGRFPDRRTAGLSGGGEDTMTTFTTIGRARESCGHEHRSLETALRCLARDVRGCDAQGGYSDRQVYARDKHHRENGRPYLRSQPGQPPANARNLNDDEQAYLETIDFPGIDKVDRAGWRSPSS